MSTIFIWKDNSKMSVCELFIKTACSKIVTDKYGSKVLFLRTNWAVRWCVLNSICTPLLPYSWAALVFKKAHTQSAELLNRFADPFVRDSEGHRRAPKHAITPLYCKNWDNAGSTGFCPARLTCHRGVPALLSGLGRSLVLEPSRWGQPDSFTRSYYTHFINSFWHSNRLSVCES